MSTVSKARDDEQMAAIQTILGELPEDHPAHEAYRAGADLIRLTYVVGREDLVDRLSEAWLDWYTKRLKRQRSLPAT